MLLRVSVRRCSLAQRWVPFWSRGGAEDRELMGFCTCHRNSVTVIGGFFTVTVGTLPRNPGAWRDCLFWRVRYPAGTLGPGVTRMPGGPFLRLLAGHGMGDRRLGPGAMPRRLALAGLRPRPDPGPAAKRRPFGFGSAPESQHPAHVRRVFYPVVRPGAKVFQLLWSLPSAAVWGRRRAETGDRRDAEKKRAPVPVLVPVTRHVMPP